MNMIKDLQLERVFTDQFIALCNTPKFVQERRRFIDEQIESRRFRGDGAVQQLIDLQNGLDSARLINGTPRAQIEHIVALIAERVSLIERLLEELQQLE